MLTAYLRTHLHLMDRNIYQTDESLHLETEDNGCENKTTSLHALLSLNTSNELIWTPAIIFRLSAISVLLLLTLLGNLMLLGNLTVIITIVSCAELWKKRVNVYIINLAIGDLLVCFLSIPSVILPTVIGQWMLGPVACKLLKYGYIVAVTSTTFLLTAMSIDRYQVRVSTYMLSPVRPYVRPSVCLSHVTLVVQWNTVELDAIFTVQWPHPYNFCGIS